LQLREKNFYSQRLAEKIGKLAPGTVDMHSNGPLSEEKSIGFFETFKEAALFIKGSGVALISILFLVLFASLGGYLDEFDALIANDMELSYIWVSVILTVRYAFVALGDILAPLVQKRISSIRLIFLVNGLACVLLAVFAAIWSHFALLIFGLAFMLMAITEILLVNALQNEIKEEGRATVMSFFGIGQNVAMICFSLVYALLAGIFTLQQVYGIIAIYGIVGGLGFYLVFKLQRI